MKLIEIVESALGKAYQSYDSTLDPNIPQKWVTIHNWYEKRYLNPDSPERETFRTHQKQKEVQMNHPTLRAANEITNEVVNERNERERKSFNKILDDTIKKIEENKRKGEVNVLSLPQSVVEALEYKGYEVQYHKACGMGDMDSHTIKWPTK